MATSILFLALRGTSNSRLTRPILLIFWPKISKNAKRQLYYDNHGDENRVFDFRVAATQQLIVSIVIPESKEEKTEAQEESKKNKESIVEGCVSAMIGFRL